MNLRCSFVPPSSGVLLLQSDCSDVMFSEPGVALDQVADARRLDRHICQHEGIAFEEVADVNVEDSSSVAVSMEALDVVRQVLDDILAHVTYKDDAAVVVGRTANHNPIKPEFVLGDSADHLARLQQLDGHADGHSFGSKVAPVDVKVNPLHAHLLFYHKRYDANQVVLQWPLLL